MIEVTYHRRFHRITATGHACSGEKGHDLVCASVSSLVLTCAANVGSLTTQGSVKKPVLRLETGDAEISCEPVHRMKNVVTLMLDTVCTGFSVLQEYYPENICYQVLE